jgi:hypothetical protein
LYGSEFLRRLDVIQDCEKLWWGGVRAFYGLPSGVSAVSLRLLFPRFSLVNRVLDSRYGLMVRGTLPLKTLFPEALLYDRIVLFSRHRKGFSQTFHDWCESLGLLKDFFACDRVAFKSSLQVRLASQLDADWAAFSSMSSTRFASNVFGSRQAFYSTALEASRLSKLGVRVFMLFISGSLSLSYCRSRICFACGSKSDFEHLLTCQALGANLVSLLRLHVLNEDWKSAAYLVISRFQVFVHGFRAGEILSEEAELFEFLNDALSVSDDNADISGLFVDQTPT